MRKFKIFNFAGKSCGVRGFNDMVNDFLESHSIISVDTKQSTEKIETWFEAESEYYLTYTIEYEEKS